MNRTQSSNLKLSLENLKCYPNPKVRDLWNKLDDGDKNAGQTFDDESSPQNNEYEYYDESQLDGRLFYIDIRYLLNCSHPVHTPPPIKQTTKTKAITESTTLPPAPPTTKVVVPSSTHLQNKTTISNHGLLDLSIFETTPKSDEIMKKEEKTVLKHEKKDDYTTSRLATVSAKPIDHKQMYEEGMASDEAKPDKLKAHRSIQDEYQDDSKFNKYDRSHSSASKNLGCVTLILAVFSFRLF